jgi:hypothetical protein
MRRELFLPWNRPRRNDTLPTGEATNRTLRAAIARLSSRLSQLDRISLDELPRREASHGYAEFAARHAPGVPR